MEAIARGGAAGAILLMRTGDVPRDSATIDLIDKQGAVIVADLSRDGFTAALDQAIASMAAEAGVKFDPPAVMRLRQRLGIERMLADKFSKDVPEIRGALQEVERLITLAGTGARVTPDMVEREISAVEGGARYELGSLFTEGKILEAVAKLRDLVAQGRREDPKMPVDMHYGRFLFPEMRVGAYDIHAERSGFRTFDKRGVNLVLGETAVINVVTWPSKITVPA